MNTHKLLIAAALSACSCSVFAQWQWVDDSGRKVFSDRPPPAHTSPQKILKQPKSAAAPAAAVLYPTTTEVLTPEAAAAQTKAAQEAEQARATQQAQERAQTEQSKAEQEEAEHDKALEEAKKKAEAEEAKKLEAQKAAARKDNCARARASQLTLESGMRLAHVNKTGERGFLSDTQRKADLQRAQKAIKDNC